ncbi:hypothetical protein GALMADRAFT_65991 [Galerina marginata CBS 339.88]|uniref:DUF4139 domain-containing protein n=1 Tax=Galerina marginata (strain CBS 339.88) TaxID=685588 RepID=A0A067TEX8_GALM3|nr:hypothetical protein GALMADRAFT_65991 [Galerina marginata CBS 339.88]
MAKPSRAAANVVELTSVNDSKITNVSLYTGLAEVTRVCSPKLKAGDNKVVISGLPNVLLPESLRVEGHGPCTIHDVSISEMHFAAPSPSTPRLDELLGQRTRVEKALTRCAKSIASVESYQNSMGVQHVEASKLPSVQHGVNSVSEELDDKLLELEERHEELSKDIEEERKALGEAREDGELRQRVSIAIFAERDCDVELVLIYGVSNATWDATYDIYVKMDTKEKAVKLIYKGAITQSTGEAWEDVPLTLETVTPTFGVSIPDLQPWTLSVFKYVPTPVKYAKKSGGLRLGGGEERKMTLYDESESHGGYGAPPPPMVQRNLLVSSKGDINATFAVPGLMTIPSDGASHNVTITELNLDAIMSWVSVPKKSTKAHLTAKIKNESDYTFLNGTASVYVDGSFISRSDIPAVSPQESFECPLGIDPTVRLIYHPRVRKINRPSFTRRTCSYLFDQRITVTNTKATAVEGVKVQEQIPVSEDATIFVNVLSPALVLPRADKKGVFSIPEPVKVGGLATAQWDGAEEPDMDPSLLGKDGKFSWICSIPSQGKLTLLLSWEVVCPYGSDIMGLDV